MTVNELIDYLRQYDGDTAVFLLSEDGPDTGDYLALDCVPGLDGGTAIRT
jgi:hypothetical protein